MVQLTQRNTSIHRVRLSALAEKELHYKDSDFTQCLRLVMNENSHLDVYVALVFNGDDCQFNGARPTMGKERLVFNEMLQISATLFVSNAPL